MKKIEQYILLEEEECRPLVEAFRNSSIHLEIRRTPNPNLEKDYGDYPPKSKAKGRENQNLSEFYTKIIRDSSLTKVSSKQFGYELLHIDGTKGKKGKPIFIPKCK